MAAVLTLATAGGALAVDLARAQVFREQLQLSADAAVLAAAVNLPDVDAARKAARTYAAKNMDGAPYVLADSDIVFGQWNPGSRTVTRDEEAPRAVRVTLRLAKSNGNAVPTIFAGVFGHDTMDVAASANAGRRGATCVLALDKATNGAMSVTGQSSLEVPGCGVQVNSRASNALTVQGTGSIAADSICVAGDASISGSAYASPTPTTYCPQVVDPLADLEPPDIGACDHTNMSLKKVNATLNPGVYCGGLDIGAKSEITLQPGVYVIKDGSLSIKSDGAISGDGVMIYLTGPGAVLDFKSKSAVSLAAPATGGFKGILIFQDRNFGGTHSWKSKVPNELRGTIYLPSGDLSSKSDNAMTPLDSCN
ncbi:MAG: TadG family pilus assembly protein, partial [Geminicoccaceae bacterium]